MATEKQATFGIRIPVETNADTAAGSVEDLRKSITGSQKAVKNYQTSLRALRGDTDEVKAAKLRLKAAISAEQGAISRATLELGKQGTTLTAVSAKTKELTSAVSGSGAVFGAASAGFAALAASVLAVGVAALASTISVGKFVLEAGNELRTMNLFREAATGSAENAKAFGTQIEALGAKIPTPRKELNELSLALSKSLIGARITGEGIVDTFNAVAQTSAAMGDAAGKSIEEIVTRGKLVGRLGLGINELQGTGIAFQDVAASLAKNLKIGIKDAQQQLFLGRVKIDDGAKALRDAVEKRFAGINLRRMLDLNVIAQKLKDSFQALTKDINLEPVLAGFAKLAGLFSVNTVTGRALKGLLEDFANTVGVVFKAGLPIVQAFFEQIVIESNDLEIALIKLAIKFKETFGAEVFDSIDAVALAVEAAKVTFALLKYAVVAVGVALLPVIAGFAAVGAAVYGAVEAIKELVTWWKKTTDIGGSGIVAGIFSSVKTGTSDLKAAGETTANNVRDGFTERLEMRSPSKVFARLTKEGIGGGIEQGANAGSKDASGAVASMVELPKPSGGVSIAAAAASKPGTAASGGGAVGPVSIEMTLNFPNAKDGKEVQATLSSPSFKAEFMRVVEEVLIGRGVPVR